MGLTLDRRAGGGCRPRGVDGVDHRHIRNNGEAAREQRERQHAEWLQTPQGRKWAENELVRRAKSESADKARKEELEKQKAHAQRWSFLMENPPEIGTIIQPDHGYTIILQGTGEGNRGFEALVILRVEGNYPKEPHYTVSTEGRQGLKVFLEHESRTFLHEKFEAHAEKASAFKGSTAYLSDIRLPLQIMSYGRNKRAAQAKLVITSPTQTQVAVSA